MSSQDRPDRLHHATKTNSHWFEDPLGEDLIQYHRVRRRLFSGKSPFQKIDIIDTGGFGKCLVLDGRIQSCEGDEFIYHESLVHPVMTAHPFPRTVLIAGGGEGATPKHVLMHPSVTSVTMVDIDEQVIEVCRRELPGLSGGTFDDRRFHLVVGDARRYIEDGRKKFDVIILDLPESLEGGPAGLLYTEEFYRAIKRRLTPGGLVTSQSDNASWGCIDAFPAIANTMTRVFPIVRPYQSHIPSFGGSWGFCSASTDCDPLCLSCADIDARLAERGLAGLRYYDGAAHLHMFSIPRHLRQRVEAEDRVITDAKPLSIRIRAA